MNDFKKIKTKFKVFHRKSIDISSVLLQNSKNNGF